jgi:MFS family permease
LQGRIVFRSISQFTPVVWLIILATMASRFVFFMVWPYLAVILHRDHGLDTFQVGAFLSVSGFSAAITGLYIGYLSDKFGRRRVIMIGLFIAILALCLLGLTENLWVILTAMLIQSVASNAIEAPGRALLTDELEDREAKDLALHMRYYSLNLGAAFGPLVGVAWGITGRQETFLIVAGVMTAYFVAAAIIFFRTPLRGRLAGKAFSFTEALTVLARDKAFQIFVLALGIGGNAYSQLEAGLIQYIQQGGEIDPVTFYPKVTFVNAATVLVLQFPLLALLSGIAPLSRAMLGISLMGIAFAMIAVVPISSQYTILFAVIVLSIGEVILFPTINLIIDRMAPDEMKGSYFGASSLAGFGFAFGPLIGGGLLHLGGGPALWWTMGALCVLVAWLYHLAEALRKQGLATS